MPFITSVFTVNYGYSGPTDPDIVNDATWFSSHGMAQTLLESNMLVPLNDIPYTTERQQWAAAAALAHRNKYLYYAIGCPTGSLQSYTKEEQLAFAKDSFNKNIASGAIPGINGSYHVYMDYEIWIDHHISYGGIDVPETYAKWLYVFSNAINYFYANMPNPGTNKMIVFHSPFSTGVSAESRAIAATYYKSWLNDLGSAISLSSKYPNLRIVSMFQDGVGQNINRRPGQSDYNNMLGMLDTHYTVCSTTDYGEAIVGNVNMEIYYWVPSPGALPPWSDMEIRIPAANSRGYGGKGGAAFAWFKYYDSAQVEIFRTAWNKYYYDQTQQIVAWINT